MAMKRLSYVKLGDAYEMDGMT
jgi:hypothetical protein